MRSSKRGLLRRGDEERTCDAGGAAEADALREVEGLLPEVVDLLTRSTSLRRGLAFVHRGPIDSVAVSLGVHPDAVDRTRDCLGRDEERKLVLREYARARTEQRAASPSTAPAARRPETHEELIERADEHPLGVQFLLCAPVETSAITFAVHPDMVLEARRMLADRGILPESS